MPAKPAARPPRPRDARTLAATLSLADGTGFLVRVLGARSTVLYEALTAQSDITPRQFGALLTLHQRGTLTLTELATATTVDRSTLGEMIRRMVARGLISRQDNAADRRSATVSITPAGVAALLALTPGAAALQDALLAPLPPADRHHFLRCLKRVALAEPE